jgi:hypothetical protein
LLGLRFRRLLLLGVLELAVIHQPAHRGNRRGGDFNKVHVGLTCQAQGLHQADNAQRLVVRPAQTDFGGHDFTVQAVLAFFTVTAVTKFSSDGSIL